MEGKTLIDYSHSYTQTILQHKLVISYIKLKPPEITNNIKWMVLFFADSG